MKGTTSIFRAVPKHSGYRVMPGLVRRLRHAVHPAQDPAGLPDARMYSQRNTISLLKVRGSVRHLLRSTLIHHEQTWDISGIWFLNMFRIDSQDTVKPPIFIQHRSNPSIPCRRTALPEKPKQPPSMCCRPGALFLSN